jgi:hypothetical protein
MTRAFQQEVKPYTFVTDSLEWARKNKPELWLKAVRKGLVYPTQVSRIEYVDKLIEGGATEEEARLRALVELPVLEYRWNVEIPEFFQALAPGVANILSLWKPKDEAVYEALTNAVSGIRTRLVREPEVNRQRAYELGPQAEELKEASGKLKKAY